MMIKTMRPIVLIALFLGCGGKGATLTESEFCSRKATRECDGVADKCLATDSNCHAARVAACEAFVGQNLAPPARPFRPERADACLNKTAEIYAKPTITPADREAMNDVCARVFSGTKKELAPCSSTFECDGALICDDFLTICATQKVVAIDGFCGNPGETCSDGQYCTGTPRKCVARIGAGQACGPDLPCLESFRCVGNPPICSARVAFLGACGADSDCLATGADAAPYCDPFFGDICTKGFTPSGGSPECVSDFGGIPVGGSDAGAD